MATISSGNEGHTIGCAWKPDHCVGSVARRCDVSCRYDSPLAPSHALSSAFQTQPSGLTHAWGRVACPLRGFGRPKAASHPRGGLMRARRLATFLAFLTGVAALVAGCGSDVHRV